MRKARNLRLQDAWQGHRLIKVIIRGIKNKGVVTVFRILAIGIGPAVKGSIQTTAIRSLKAPLDADPHDRASGKMRIDPDNLTALVHLNPELNPFARRLQDVGAVG